LKNINKKDIKLLVAPWLNWTEQPPPKGQVAGSNPAGVANQDIEFYNKNMNSCSVLNLTF
jgi:hypothetical protein